MNRSTSESASAPTTRPVTSATWASRRAGSATAGTSSSTSVEPTALACHRHLTAGQTDVGADDDQAVPVGSAGRPDVRRLQRRLRVQPGQWLRERRTGPVQERLPVGLRLEQAEDDDVEVGVLDGVDHDERPVGHVGENLGDPLGSADADVVEGEAAHLVRRDGAPALLRDELPQVRRREPEGGVAGEFRLADGQRLARDPRPVHVTGGESACLQIGRHQQHPVVAAAEDLPAHRVQRGDLGDDVPAQGGVAAADDVDRRVEAPAELEQGAADAGVQRNCVCLAHAAGVGEDEAGRAGPVEPGGDLLGIEDGDHGHVVHRLRPGGVVVEHRDPAPRRGQRLSDPLPRVRLHPHRRESGQVRGRVRHGIGIRSVGGRQIAR